MRETRYHCGQPITLRRDIELTAETVYHDGDHDWAHVTDAVIKVIREAMLSDEVLTRAFLHYTAEASYISVADAERYWEALREHPEHSEDFDDSREGHLAAMREGITAALTAAGIGGDDDTR